MPLDPVAQAMLEQMAASGAPPMHQMEVADARSMSGGMAALAGEPEQVAKVDDRTIDVPDGQIPVRIYTPEGSGPFPILVYFHGGGWVLGDIDALDVPCRAMANQVGCVVVSVGYRLAPEHKFPAAAEDAYAATKWAADHAPELNADAGRLAVAGDSAGGNLAAVVALMARDRGGPALRLQALIYPVTVNAYDTESYKQNGENYLLTKDAMVWFWNHYLRTPEDGKNPYASPLLADNLRGLPPAVVITAEYDPLRDEGEQYAAKLKQSGVKVEMKRYDGMLHGFFQFSGMFQQGKEAIAQTSRALNAAFG